MEATEREGASTVVLNEADIELADVLTDLQDRTQLTRRSIQRILSASTPSRSTKDIFRCGRNSVLIEMHKLLNYNNLSLEKISQG